MDKDLLEVVKSICTLIELDHNNGVIWKKNGANTKLPSGGVSYGYTLEVAKGSNSFSSTAHDSKKAAADILYGLERKAFLHDCYEHTVNRTEGK
jgi:hypothetical protein